MAIKLTSFSEEGLVRFLQCNQETQLTIKVNLKSYRDISYLKIIEDQSTQLIHLTEFSLTIPHCCALTEKGYTHISNAIKNLTKLTKLSIQIEGFIQNEELVLLQNSIQYLSNLRTLRLSISQQNDINSQVGKQFLNSLSSLLNLRKLSLHYIKNSGMNEGNVHFWNGFQSLQNLEKLTLLIKSQDFGQQDIKELFSHILDLQQLKRFSFTTLDYRPSIEFIDIYISSVGKMKNLQSIKMNFKDNSEYQLNENQRKDILKNLSNLKYLEKLKMKTIQVQLMKHHLEEYADLIGSLQYLKKLSIECNSKDIQEAKTLNKLGQSFLTLTNITNLELNFRSILVYNEFISDLSKSLLNMKRLSNLRLNLAGINNCQSAQLSSCLNQLHNLTSLLIDIPSYQKKEMTSLIFQDLDDGLINLKELTLRVEGGYYNNNFYTFIHKLINLETLELSKICLRSDEDFILINQTLSNLKQLKVFDISFNISQYLYKESSVQILESTFKELQSLESLKILLSINRKSESIRKMNILEHLKNLKKLSIEFTFQVLSVFDLSPSSLTNQYVLEDVEITTQYTEQSTETILQMLISLSCNFSMIKKLKFKTCLIGDSTHSKIFSKICSNLTNLQTLILEDDSENNPMWSFRCRERRNFYVQGIKQLKGLKCLKLDYTYEEEEVRELGESLQKLENLRKIILNINTSEEDFLFKQEYVSKLGMSQQKLKYLRYMKLNTNTRVKNDLQNLEKQLSHALRHHNKLKETKINLNYYDYVHQRVSNIVSLNQVFNEKEELRFDQQNMQNETMVTDESKKQEEIKFQDNMKSEDLRLFPNNLQINIYKKEGEEDLIGVNNLNNIGLQYLMNLRIKVDISEQLTVKGFTIQFNQLNQLRSLTLELSKLTFSQEQIISFSKNMRHLVNLNQLHIKNDWIDDDYSYFFDEFKHLKQLQTFSLNTAISEKAVISLGNWLNEVNNLEVCTLQFNSNKLTKSSQFGIQGLLLILNGVKGQLNMDCLNLNFSSEEVWNQNSQEIDVMVSDFFSKMNKLSEFEFRFSFNNQEIKYTSLFSSLGQLPSFETLTINLSIYHPQQREMLEQLINSINQLTHLRSVSITYQDQDNNENDKLIIPKQLSNYFNRQIDNPLKISLSSHYIELLEGDNFTFKIYAKSITNTKLDFIEDLDEKKVIEFDCSRSCWNVRRLTILTQIERYKAKQIRLTINIADEKETNDFCTFITRIPQVSALYIDMKIQMNLTKESLIEIEQSISKLKNLNTLCFLLSPEVDFVGRFRENQLLQMVSIFQNLQKLQALYLDTSSFHSEPIIQIIQKKMKRVVNYELLFKITDKYKKSIFLQQSYSLHL